MTNVILPIVYYWMAVGKTINIRNYDLGGSNTPIYNKTDVVENPVSCSFNASYYVLPDGNIPFEKVGAPMDYILRAKHQGSGSGLRRMLKGYDSVLTADDVDMDNAIVLVLAECKTSEETVKENANPVPNWQDIIPERDQQTHYADKIVHGGQVISLLRIRSIVTSDVQVFRRILRDIMGTSGSVTANTAELWKTAENAIHESPDVRGKGRVYIDHYTKIWNARKPGDFSNNGDLLRYVSEFPDYVESYSAEYIRSPLYVSFKPLHDLDERYPSLEKDADAERYLAKLYRLMKDVEFAYDAVTFVNRFLSQENEMKFLDFRRNLRNVTRTLNNVFRNSLSVYEDIDKVALLKAFEYYQKGLDNTTEDYMTLFKKLREKMDTAITCGSDFLTPTSGQLRVNENEVVKKGKVEDFEECSDFCVEDERCRALGYSDKECLVYNRSTYSATISLPVGDLEGMKIYDRKCEFTN